MVNIRITSNIFFCTAQILSNEYAGNKMLEWLGMLMKMSVITIPKRPIISFILHINDQSSAYSFRVSRQLVSSGIYCRYSKF